MGDLRAALERTEQARRWRDSVPLRYLTGADARAQWQDVDALLNALDAAIAERDEMLVNQRRDEARSATALDLAARQFYEDVVRNNRACAAWRTATRLRRALGYES